MVVVSVLGLLLVLGGAVLLYLGTLSDQGAFAVGPVKIEAPVSIILLLIGVLLLAWPQTPLWSSDTTTTEAAEPTTTTTGAASTVVADSDGDGIVDTADECPDTTENAAVNSLGCSDAQVLLFDDDDDGVVNGTDDCPRTAEVVAVDTSGCSEEQLQGQDDDGDEVTNALDDCPRTPQDESVDSDGCSGSQLDADGDKVGNAIDRCTQTPVGEAVDDSGCSDSQIDSDGDGFFFDEDCQDENAAINPGAIEIPDNNIDEDCDDADSHQCDTLFRTAHPADIQVWALDRFGDLRNKEFDSHGPDVYAEVRSDWTDGQKIDLQVYFQAIESTRDWTQASDTSGWTNVFEVKDDGFKIHSVTAGGMVVPRDGRGSSAASFGQRDGRGGVLDPNVADFGKEVARRFNEEASAPDGDELHGHGIHPFPGSGLVSIWRLVGDGGGDDVGNDNGDLDANVTVSFNRFEIVLIETGDCVAAP